MGEKLHALGYPTLLFLKSKERELFRFDSQLSFNEFKQVVQSVMASSGSLSAVMKDTLSGNATKDEWR